MSTAVIARPNQSEYMSYYGKYISLVPEGNVVETIERQLDETLALFGRISDADAGDGEAFPVCEGGAVWYNAGGSRDVCDGRLQRQDVYALCSGEDGQGREGIGASLLKPTACG